MKYLIPYIIFENFSFFLQEKCEINVILKLIAIFQRIFFTLHVGSSENNDKFWISVEKSLNY